MGYNVLRTSCSTCYSRLGVSTPEAQPASPVRLGTISSEISRTHQPRKIVYVPPVKQAIFDDAPRENPKKREMIEEEGKKRHMTKGAVAEARLLTRVCFANTQGE